MPSDVHVALYRIAQEALNNAGKHADATQVEIGLQCLFSAQEGDQVAGVELYVSDDGCGFDPGTVPPERLGLNIIRERVQAIGAQLEIASRPDCGTRVTVVWEEDGGD